MVIQRTLVVIGAAITLAFGLVVGTTVWSSASGDDGTSAENSSKEGSEAPTEQDILAHLEAQRTGPKQTFETLENGGTVGVWQVWMSPEERPDYVEARLDDGTIGYAKISDFYVDSPFTFDGESAEPKAISQRELDAYLDAQKNTLVQADENGEKWAPVYDRDGETVIGKVLVSG